MAAKKKNKTAPRRPPPTRSGPKRSSNVRAKGTPSSAKAGKAGAKKAAAKSPAKPKAAGKPKAASNPKTAGKPKAAGKPKGRPASATAPKTKAKVAAKPPPMKKSGAKTAKPTTPPQVAPPKTGVKPASAAKPRGIAKPKGAPVAQGAGLKAGPAAALKAGQPLKGPTPVGGRVTAPARGPEPSRPAVAAAPPSAGKPLGKGRGKAGKLASSRVGKPLADSPAIAVRKTTSESSRRPSERPLRESNRPPAIVSLPIPVLPVVRRPSVEERAQSIDERLAAQTDDFRRRYLESFDMSWIYHDSALEGVVYTYAELRAALGDEPLPVTDSSLQPTVEDIRRHKEAIDFVRDFATKKQKAPVTVDVVKKIYLILHPSEGDIKTVKYRKDIPQHRLYFHEYAAPDKIAYKVRQVVDWINDPETRKTRNGLRLAARAHYDMLRVFPFPVDSGKVCRLFMNLLLMRTGLPPAIIHSTERQRYYDALKGSASTVLSMVQEAVENALSSVEKLLDEHETKTRAFVS